MTYRSILVHAQNTAPGIRCMEAAAASAAKFGAVLTGCFLKSERVPSYVVGDGLVVPSVNVESYHAQRAAEIAEGSAQTREAFAHIVARTGVKAEWLDVNADTNGPIASCARRHDLCVLPVEMQADHGDHVIEASQIGMAAGRPLLVVPERGFPAIFGRRILIAWNDSRESARALRDAMPYLSQAEEVHFVVVSRHARSDLDTLLQRHLELHGVRSTTLSVERDDSAPTGDLIRKRIDLVGADMVVLGLYGRSRLQEFVLGGVTRNLLEHLRMPLLVSH